MMKLFFVLCIIFFFGINHGYAQSGLVKIKIYTNVNEFSCWCNESSFTWVDVMKAQKILKLPLCSFSCTKHTIKKDLMKLFEAEKHPYISIEIVDYEKTNDTIFTNVKITIKEKAKMYRLQLEKTQDGVSKYLQGNQQLNLNHYHIAPPVKALGIVKVKPKVDIKFIIPQNFILEQ